MAFSLAVYHTYFENDICNCLQFKPAPSTALLFQKFGFRINEKINGFDFFSNTPGPVSTLFSYITKATGLDYFEFEMTTDNSSFMLFTNLPVDWIGQLVFDSGSPANKFVNGKILLAEDLSPSASAPETGTVKIHFADILKYQESDTSAVFEIRLDARSTQWQYYIVNKSPMQMNALAITGKAGISFEGPESVIIPTGQQALLFSSGTNLLPLSKIPKYKFDLVNVSATGNLSAVKKMPGGKVIFKGLPNPDPGYSGIVTVNGKKQSSSPMYVYV